MRSHWLAWLALFSVSCVGDLSNTKDSSTSTPGDDDDSDADADSDTDSDTDTDPSPFFDIAVLRIDAEFSYDDTTDSIIDANSDYGLIPSAISLYFGTIAWEASGLDTADINEYCVIVLPLLGAPLNNTWAAAAGLWKGFDYDVANAALTNCGTQGYELDPAVWGNQLEVDMAEYGWGIGVGELGAAYVATYSTSTVADQVLGGYVNNTFLPVPEGLEGYVALGFEINDANTIIVDAASGILTPLDNADVFDGTLSRGYYALFARVYWVFN